jgi:beta-lactamase regulating signal transducer with metallopeptidase domain
MLQLINLFAAVTDIEGLPTAEATKLFGMNIRDFMLLVGAVLVLAAVLFFWAYAARRTRQVVAGHPRALYRAEPRESDEDGRRRFRKKRRRVEAPDTLPRNPTLSETGGLPPVREESIEPTQ